MSAQCAWKDADTVMTRFSAAGPDAGRDQDPEGAPARLLARPVMCVVQLAACCQDESSLIAAHRGPDLHR